MEDVDVTVNGEQVVTLKDVGLDYNFLTFLTDHVVLDHIRLNQPTLHLTKTAKGWSVVDLIKAQTPEKPRNRKPIEIGEIGVTEGTLYLESQPGAGPVGTSGITVPAVIEKIDASVGVSSDVNELKVDIRHVALRGSNPRLGINDLSGIVRRHEDSITIENLSLRTEETSLRAGGSIRGLDSGNPLINIKASSDKFSVGELANVLPALRPYENLQPAFEINASGPADRLDVQVNAREKQVGQIAGTLMVDTLGPERRVAGDVKTQHVNVGPLVRGTAVKTDITGRGKIDLTLPSSNQPFRGTYVVNAQRAMVVGYDARNVAARGRINWPSITVDGSASAYGGRATAKGTIVAGSPLRLDLTGRAAHVDLRNLPSQLSVPGVPSNLQFSYTLTGRGPMFSGDLTLDESMLADVTIAGGTVASFRAGAGAPAYGAKGHVSTRHLQTAGHD